MVRESHSSALYAAGSIFLCWSRLQVAPGSVFTSGARWITAVLAKAFTACAAVEEGSSL
jgi:hypothetical protein